MAASNETGWQPEMTLLECMRYMLDTGVAADVCFKVGPPDGATVNIMAHKFMLISRCPVFKTMFSSGMTECLSGPHAVVKVEDIDAGTFKDLLKYIYCETTSVNMETAPALMYAADKYMLPKLLKECGKCLLEGLDINNVVHVLHQSLLFNDIRNNCLKWIALHASSIFIGEEILSASQQTMEAILQTDKLPVKEVDIYETSLRWAKHQLQIQQSEENPTDQQIREFLGALLYKIHFPIMDHTEFVEISEGKNILTPEEQLSIHRFFVTKRKNSQLLFPTERRIMEVWIERAEICHEYSNQSMQALHRLLPIFDAIDFTTDQDIRLTGIGLYLGLNNSVYEVDIEILQLKKKITKCLLKKKFTKSPLGGLHQFKVSLDKPIFIQAGILYSITALSHGSIGYYASSCQSVCTKGNTTFTFSTNYDSDKLTSEHEGQIPRLYFCHC